MVGVLNEREMMGTFEGWRMFVVEVVAELVVGALALKSSMISICKKKS